MKIRNSVFAIIVIVLVITSTSTFFGIEFSSQKITTEITGKIEALSQNTMNEISKLMFERQADVKQLSDIRNPILHDPNITVKLKMDYLRTIEKTSKAFTSISLYDENGIKIGNTRNIGIGDDDSDKPFFVSAMNGQHYVDDKPVFSSLLNLNVIHFSGPIYDENGIPNGVVMAEFPLNKITSIINYNEGLISETNFDLVSDDGTVIFSKNTREDAFSRSLNNIAAFDTLKNSQEKVISTIDNGKLLVIVSQNDYLDYSGNNWYLFVSIPLEIVLQEVNDFRTNAIILTVIVIVIGFIIASIFSRSITKPIVSLQEVFSKVMSRDYEKQAEIKGSDEIKQLARTVNEMTHSLKKTVELEKQLVRAEENIKKERFTAIGKLAGSLAHDIRNPLHLIQMSAGIMKKENPESTKQFDKSFSLIEKSVSRINHQINDVMDFLRNTPLQIERISIQHILKSVCSNLEIPTNIAINISSEDIVIECDRVKLESVITNIVFNAIQAIDKNDGNISIDLTKNEDEVTIKISNDGSPIPEEDLPRIFEPLYTTKFKGTGLGLASCKNMIELHHGTISVSSDPVSFQIKIPLEQSKKN